MYNKFLVVSLTLLLSLSLVSCGNRGGKKTESQAPDSLSLAQSLPADSLSTADSVKVLTEAELIQLAMNTSEPLFDIITTEGVIRIKLYDKTPKHKENFIKLVGEHYYDDLLFHRVIEGFMIQTGDPYTRDTSMVDLYGQGGPDYTIPAEFVNEYWHKKGAVAAARRGDMANPKKSSSGSQFYIVQDEDACLHLDGQYTIFGETVEGFEVIDRIASATTDRYDRPIHDIRIISIKPVQKEEEQQETGAGQ